jgi:pyruvate/2-oxoglutarate dehydrogenase complex dihydrolipoamide acyltransferase (E2) component
MSVRRGYRVEPFGGNRQMVAASSAVGREKDTIHMQKRFGVVGVTAVGMFGSGPMWLIPLTSATVTVAVGAIAKRLVLVDGGLQEREHVCLTVSFDHDIVDGAPAARFTSRFAELLSSGDELRDSVG